MFAQQIMAQHARANQPMGILASSPQLMGAVQGFKDGGEVKGYKYGGGNFIPGQTSNKSIIDRLERANKAVYQPKVPLKQTFNEPGPITSLDDVQKIKIEPSVTVKKDEVKPDKVVVPEVDNFEKGSVQPFVPKRAEIEEPGAVINKTNEKLTQSDKELKDNIPQGVNLGKKTDTKDIDKKIKEASTSYEGFKEKLATTDKRYEADEAKRTDYMKKIEDIMETEEDEISLDDVDKKAREVLGLKEGEYDDDRVTAFWMSMIKGGLATAAGESSNALTNIAKGLMFGVDSYGKDMNNITLQEREDRQNLAKMKYNLMKDEKAAKVAERTLKIQAYGELAKLEENKFQFKTEQEYKVARNEVLDNLAMAKLDLTSMQVLNAMKMGDLNYEAKIREISLNEAKQKDYVRLTEKQLSMQLRDKQATKEIKNIFALGSDYATYEDGEFKFTKKGRAMLIASTASKTKFTDLVTSAKAAGKNKTIEGYKYGTSEQAEDAYYYYVGVTKPKLEALVKTTKGNLGTIDNEEYRKQEKAILKQFAKDTGGVLEGDGGTGFVEDKIYTDKNGVKKRYKNGQFVDP
tara:strand:+ start:289 stop:2013 length:1725 start_codon:yes stop_codon:yes gene_type:complete